MKRIGQVCAGKIVTEIDRKKKCVLCTKGFQKQHYQAPETVGFDFAAKIVAC
jgi:hypothetical protein